MLSKTGVNFQVVEYTERGNELLLITETGPCFVLMKPGIGIVHSSLFWRGFMNSFLKKLFAWAFRRQPEISCEIFTWQQGVKELQRRTNGSRRESGAFLLGTTDSRGKKHIRDFVFYDDVDPHALDSGIVHFQGHNFSTLWEICRSKGYGVVADVHVHPAGYQQSDSDKMDPVMPRDGHIAFILPHFAQGTNNPGDIGIFKYRGGTAWEDHSSEGEGFFKMGSET